MSNITPIPSDNILSNPLTSHDLARFAQCATEIHSNLRRLNESLDKYRQCLQLLHSSSIEEKKYGQENKDRFFTAAKYHLGQIKRIIATSFNPILLRLYHAVPHRFFYSQLTHVIQKRNFQLAAPADLTMTRSEGHASQKRSKFQAQVVPIKHAVTGIISNTISHTHHFYTNTRASLPQQTTTAKGGRSVSVQQIPEIMNEADLQRHAAIITTRGPPTAVPDAFNQSLIQSSTDLHFKTNAFLYPPNTANAEDYTTQSTALLPQEYHNKLQKNASQIAHSITIPPNAAQCPTTSTKTRSRVPLPPQQRKEYESKYNSYLQSSASQQQPSQPTTLSSPSTIIPVIPPVIFNPQIPPDTSNIVDPAAQQAEVQQILFSPNNPTLQSKYAAEVQIEKIFKPIDDDLYTPFQTADRMAQMTSNTNTSQSHASLHFDPVKQRTINDQIQSLLVTITASQSGEILKSLHSHPILPYVNKPLAAATQLPLAVHFQLLLYTFLKITQNTPQLTANSKLTKSQLVSTSKILQNNPILHTLQSNTLPFQSHYGSIIQKLVTILHFTNYNDPMLTIKQLSDILTQLLKSLPMEPSNRAQNEEIVQIITKKNGFYALFPSLLGGIDATPHYSSSTVYNHLYYGLSSREIVLFMHNHLQIPVQAALANQQRSLLPNAPVGTLPITNVQLLKHLHNIINSNYLVNVLYYYNIILLKKSVQIASRFKFTAGYMQKHFFSPLAQQYEFKRQGNRKSASNKLEPVRMDYNYFHTQFHTYLTHLQYTYQRLICTFMSSLQMASILYTASHSTVDNTPYDIVLITKTVQYSQVRGDNSKSPLHKQKQHCDNSNSNENNSTNPHIFDLPTANISHLSYQQCILPYISLLSLQYEDLSLQYVFSLLSNCLKIPLILTSIHKFYSMCYSTSEELPNEVEIINNGGHFVHLPLLFSTKEDLVISIKEPLPRHLTALSFNKTPFLRDFIAQKPYYNIPQIDIVGFNIIIPNTYQLFFPLQYNPFFVNTPNITLFPQQSSFTRNLDPITPKSASTRNITTVEDDDHEYNICYGSLSDYHDAIVATISTQKENNSNKTTKKSSPTTEPTPSFPTHSLLLSTPLLHSPAASGDSIATTASLTAQCLPFCNFLDLALRASLLPAHKSYDNHNSAHYIPNYPHFSLPLRAATTAPLLLPYTANLIEFFTSSTHSYTILPQLTLNYTAQMTQAVNSAIAIPYMFKDIQEVVHQVYYNNLIPQQESILSSNLNDGSQQKGNKLLDALFIDIKQYFLRFHRANAAVQDTVPTQTTLSLYHIILQYFTHQSSIVCFPFVMMLLSNINGFLLPTNANSSTANTTSLQQQSTLPHKQQYITSANSGMHSRTTHCIMTLTGLNKTTLNTAIIPLTSLSSSPYSIVVPHKFNVHYDQCPLSSQNSGNIHNIDSIDEDACTCPAANRSKQSFEIEIKPYLYHLNPIQTNVSRSLIHLGPVNESRPGMPSQPPYHITKLSTTMTPHTQRHIIPPPTIVCHQHDYNAGFNRDAVNNTAQMERLRNVDAFMSLIIPKKQFGDEHLNKTWVQNFNNIVDLYCNTYNNTTMKYVNWLSLCKPQTL